MAAAEHGDVDGVASRSPTPASSEGSAQTPSGRGTEPSYHGSTMHNIKREPALSHEFVAIPTRRATQLSEHSGSASPVSPGSALESRGKTGHRSFHAPETWEFYKLEIRRLYIDENKPLREVNKALSQRGFHAT
jgi:hypothetical protein